MAIPISARQLEGLNRLAEAYAKIRLSLKISSEDAHRAISLMESCLREIATDPATGEIDIDKVFTGITTYQRGNLTKIKEIIENLGEESGKIIQIERIIEEASAHNISEEVVISSIEKLKKSGDIYEPRKGYVSKV
jgi:replicative DNA helicase Mcm